MVRKGPADVRVDVHRLDPLNLVQVARCCTLSLG